jgi:23S rRNA (guanosine2251-2'-O)-methyltransferase
MKAKKGQPERRKRQNGPDSAGLVYGVLPVLEALRADHRRIDKVLIAAGAQERRIAEIVDLCRNRAVRCDRIGREVLAKYTGDDVNHQGVVAFASAADYVDVEDIIDTGGGTPLLLVLDGIEDPRNFGAIIRVAECAGVDGIIIPDRRAAGLTDTVAKSSAGAVEYVKIAKTGNLNRFIEGLRSRDVWIVGAAADSATDYTEWDWTRPTALVLGSEGRGMHRLVAENCDLLVKIPMYGKIDSLNVSVAAGVILFEAKRQRSKAE